MASYVGADSLGYLSLEALTDTAAGPNKGPDKGLCAACFTGNYPIPVQPDLVGQGIAKGKGSTHPELPRVHRRLGCLSRTGLLGSSSRRNAASNSAGGT